VGQIEGYRWNMTFRCWNTKSKVDDEGVKSSSQRIKKCSICSDSYSSGQNYAKHLNEEHSVTYSKRALIPYDLGQCPFCDQYFYASRGWKQHVNQCKVKRALDSGVWPRPCSSWWTGEKQWYEGVAISLSDDTQPSYRVQYPDGSEFVEPTQFVVFTTMAETKSTSVSSSTTFTTTPTTTVATTTIPSSPASASITMPATTVIEQKEPPPGDDEFVSLSEDDVPADELEDGEILPSPTPLI
jgi:uncharacterized C2H2 Zn-finger protein